MRTPNMESIAPNVGALTPSRDLGIWPSASPDCSHGPNSNGDSRQRGNEGHSFTQDVMGGQSETARGSAAIGVEEPIAVDPLAVRAGMNKRDNQPGVYFKTKGNTVESPEAGEILREGFMCCKKGCKSRFCSQCCIGLGIKLRERLKIALATFTSVQMWTFTLDPLLFSNAKAAFDYVRAKRCIGELVKVLRKRGGLHSGRYFFVVEWQRNGFPHWHVLLDASFVHFDLVISIWNRFRPAWAGPVVGTRPGFGSVRFTMPEFATIDHAACYVTKYLTKPPKCDYPEWVKASRDRVRRFGTSRGFWGPGVERRGHQHKADEREQKNSPSKEHAKTCFCRECRVGVRGSTIAERVAKCGHDAGLYRVCQFVGSNGKPELQMEYLGMSELPYVAAAELVKFDSRASGFWCSPEEARQLLPPFLRWRIEGDEGA